MRAKDKIARALTMVFPSDEVNAGQIYKNNNGQWVYRPFNAQEIELGRNLQEALESAKERLD